MLKYFGYLKTDLLCDVLFVANTKNEADTKIREYKLHHEDDLNSQFGLNNWQLKVLNYFPTLHIDVTYKCGRDCPQCCIKQAVKAGNPRPAFVTPEELSTATKVLLTGGEPFLFTNPCEIASTYKKNYPNIRNIYVYTNAFELAEFLKTNKLYSIDGLTVSIKEHKDILAFKKIINNEDILRLPSNILYNFTEIPLSNIGNFIQRERYWQSSFVAAPDTIGRCMETNLSDYVYACGTKQEYTLKKYCGNTNI